MRQNEMEMELFFTSLDKYSLKDIDLQASESVLVMKHGDKDIFKIDFGYKRIKKESMRAKKQKSSLKMTITVVFE